MFHETFFRPYRWDPFRELARLPAEMSPWFWGASGEALHEGPALNVWTGREGALVTVELPGLRADSLDVSVLGQTLTLRGERQAEALAEGVTRHRRERPTGGWTRTVELPFRVDSDKVEAWYERGVLRIQVPRADADKPRKITIKTN